jgi:hypothetical protein
MPAEQSRTSRSGVKYFPFRSQLLAAEESESSMQPSRLASTTHLGS